MADTPKNRPVVSSDETPLTNEVLAQTSTGQSVTVVLLNDLAASYQVKSSQLNAEAVRIGGVPGVQFSKNAVDASKLQAAADKRAAKAAARNTTDTLAILAQKIAELEQKVDRLLGCYPICSATPAPTPTKTATPVPTPTKTRAATPTPSPTKFPEFIPSPGVTKTPAPTPSIG